MVKTGQEQGDSSSRVKNRLPDLFYHAANMIPLNAFLKLLEMIPWSEEFLYLIIKHSAIKSVNKISPGAEARLAAERHPRSLGRGRGDPQQEQKDKDTLTKSLYNPANWLNCKGVERGYQSRLLTDRLHTSGVEGWEKKNTPNFGVFTSQQHCGSTVTFIHLNFEDRTKYTQHIYSTSEDRPEELPVSVLNRI